MKIDSGNAGKVRSLWSNARMDESQNEGLKTQITKLDDKLQQMLLWSNILALWACIQMIFTVTRIYGSLSGSHPALMALTLIVIVALLAIFLFFVWKSIAYKNRGFRKASKTYLNYQIKKITGQVKLMSGYILVYSILMITSGIFFYLDIENGLTVLFKSTAPIMLVMYVLGFYFMMSFVREKRKLETLEKRVDHLGLMEKVIQN